MKMRSGNTVLEMLVALFILMVGLMAVIGLSFRNVTMGRESLKELQAANFAREGIEIVRNIRDSNKYKTGFTQGDTIWDGLRLTGPRIIDNTEFVNPSSTSDQVLKLESYTTDPSLQSINKIWQRPAPDHFFVQGGIHSTMPLDSTETGFYRKINLHAICENDVFERPLPGRTSSTACALTGGTMKLIGIEVVAEVSWKDTTQPRLLTVEERLYNW